MTSQFIKHIPCENCHSSDANSLYDDGHTYCFSCDHTTFDKEADNVYEFKPKGVTVSSIVQKGTFKPITDRGITQQTCEKFGVTQTGTHHYYPFYDEGGFLVATKEREVKNKTFSITGNFNNATLFGQSLFHAGGKYVTLYEGELDALAGYQMTGSQWPSVSIRNGAKAAIKDCKAQYEWLNSFETIVICFDADEPGQKAAKEVAELFGQKAKIVKHKGGYKDACEYLQGKATKEFVNEWWRAETFTPDGIINAADLWEEINKPEKQATALYPWNGLNKLLFGLREAELITITAGSGLGKSQFLREILYHLLKTTSFNIGGLFLEESAKKTARSIMSIHANKLLHLPDTPVTEEELKEAFDATIGTNRVYLFDHFGSSDIDNIVNRVRYLAKAFDCRVIFLDHLSIIVSGNDSGDERKVIDGMMTKLRTLVQELNITLICVSHLRRPTGNVGHEDGGSVSLSQLRGSGSIAQLSDAVITLERNSMSESDVERNTTKVAVAKNRFSGFTGPACSLLYARDTGRLTEVVEESL